MRSDDEYRNLLDRVAEGLQGRVKPPNLLGVIAWPSEVETEFFARGAQQLPEVSYQVDRERARQRIGALTELHASIEGDDPVAGWLRATVQSYIDGNRLILAVGTRAFHTLSVEVYGSAKTRFYGERLSNADLAEHLLDRMAPRGWDEAQDKKVEPLSAEQFVSALRDRLERRRPRMELDVVTSEECAAKAICGRSRVRVRSDATFLPWEVDSLWAHEVETHALSAQNGAAQERAPFLRAGGPRATRTQEGLAIFSELYTRQLSIDRMERLAVRVKLVEMAEDGADFLELYRYLLDRGRDSHEAFMDAQRVCRGGLVEGGAPFTKDACYLAGLMQVYRYLAIATRAGNRDETEMLVAGRIALEDMPALVELRHRGILSRPRFIPTWLSEWRSLLPYFAFASFANEVGLEPYERRYARVLELAESQPPADDDQR